MRAIRARSAAVIRSVLEKGVLIGSLSWMVALVVSLPLSARVGGVLAPVCTQEFSLQGQRSAPGCGRAFKHPHGI
jgi:hypothetical protein